MIFKTMLWIIFAAALIGLSFSIIILRSKATAKPLVCVIGDDCDKVVRSAYSTTFGIPNEVAGSLYFALMAFLSAWGILGLESVFGFALAKVLLALSILPACFSLYLLGIQMFVLKEWCEYCIVVGIASISIALTNLLWFFR